MKIKIGAPYIINKNSQVRLNADIEFENEQFTLWFEVEEEFGEYFCIERADAFFTVILPWALIRSSIETPLEIECVAPLSERLYHQVTMYHIPVLVQEISYYNTIKITSDLACKPLTSQFAVATGVSAGVDSSYSIVKYMDYNIQKYRLTHGVFYNMAMYGDYDSESVRALRNKAIKVCKEANIKFMQVSSNVCVKLYGKAHAPIVPYIFIGAALALQKLFSVYYFSAGYSAKDFIISEVSAAYYDLLTVQNFSTENVQFYSSGVETTRIEKVRTISGFPFTYDNLSVCLSVDQTNGNCGLCAKCTRTMAELEALGMLDRYKNVFDIDAFRSDPGYHWGYVLLKSRNDSYCKEVMNLYRKSGRRFPLSVYISCVGKWIKRGFTSENRKREKVNNEICKLQF